MLSGPELLRLAEKVMMDDKLKMDHPAKILARAVLTMDNPDRFVRNITPGPSVPKPERSAHRPRMRVIPDEE